MKTCAWCGKEIPSTMRSDSVCCSTRCRQARHRFGQSVGAVAVGRGTPIRIAYADPPYPGLSKRYYGDHPDYAGEVDHVKLIEQLAGFDGWALSTSARSLQDVYALCPPGTRVAPWLRGDRGSRSAGPLNAWEPVLYYGGRLDVDRDAYADPSRVDVGRVASGSRTASRSGELENASRYAGKTRRVDALILHAHPRTTDPFRVIGSKPAGFCRWMFDLLGAEPQDEFTDLFPGSGGVMRAWRIFSGQDEGPAPE